jgi:peptidoglycan hydrolase-like protein with peptidoglycan-binding domain/predicted phosphodiesterase
MKIIITEKQLKLLKESKDESILLVGDSHTVDAGFTWSSLMKKNFDNVKIIAIGGKRTSWMKEQLQNELKNKKYDKVIIWGGNNDTFSLTPNSQAISNIQQMVDMVNSQGGKAYVIQGYDYEIFADPEKYKPTKYANKEDMKKFRKKYIDFQNELGSSISGAVVIPKFKVENSHAPDNVHGDSAAHKMVFNDVVNYLNNSTSPIKKSEEDKSKSSDVLVNLEKYIESGKNFEPQKESPPYEKEVEDLQTGLQFLGFSLPEWGVDGKFGPETKKAVQDFQNSVGLEETGEVGNDELKKLVSLMKSKGFESYDLTKIKKEKTDKLKTLTKGENIVIDNPGVSVVKYPSNLMEKFQKIAGDDYDEFISGCNSIGLNPETAVRQLFTESGFSPDVINCSRKSSAGALGIAQFMPGTWKSYGNGSPCNVSDSLKAYIKLMGDNLKRFPNRPDLAVAAYNSGPNLKAYNNALNNELDFTDLKGKIPNESYKYSASIFQA